MLTPDVAEIQSGLQAQQSAAAPVTQYCTALTTLLPAFASAVTDPAAAALVTQMTTDAGTWSTLCGDYTSSGPTLIIASGGSFAQSYTALAAQVKTLEANPADQVTLDAFTAGLNSLINTLLGLRTPLQSMAAQLASFMTTLETDHTALETEIDALSAQMAGGPGLVKDAEASLQLDYLSSQQLSPCIAIVEMQSSVQTDLETQASQAPNLIPLVIGRSMLTTLSNSNAGATTALTALLDAQAALLAKYKSALHDLQNAAGPALPPVLAGLQLDAANLAWQQAVEFAQTLLPTQSATDFFE